MVATAYRKDVSGRRSKASRRGGKQNSGRNAAQLAQKLRARGTTGSWAQPGGRPGPPRKLKKSRLSVTVVGGAAKSSIFRHGKSHGRAGQVASVAHSA